MPAKISSSSYAQMFNRTTGNEEPTCKIKCFALHFYLPYIL